MDKREKISFILY